MVLLVVVEVLETSSSHYRWEALPISYTTVREKEENRTLGEDFILFSFAGGSLSTRDTFSFMARPARLERATRGLEGRCSIQLSYGRKEMFCEVGWFSYYSCPHFQHPTLQLGCETVPFYSHTQNIGGRDESRTRKRG